MDSTQFVYWLNGFIELSGGAAISEEQVKIIKDHISLVLKKETPNYDELLKKKLSQAPTVSSVVPKLLCDQGIPSYFKRTSSFDDEGKLLPINPDY